MPVPSRGVSMTLLFVLSIMYFSLAGMASIFIWFVNVQEPKVGGPIISISFCFVAGWFWSVIVVLVIREVLK